MNDELEKLKRLNEFMRDKLIWFAENAWTGDQAYWAHKQALADLEQLDNEIDKEFAEAVENEKWLEMMKENE